MKEISYIEPATLAKACGAVIFGLTLLWIIPTEMYLLKGLFTNTVTTGQLLFAWIGLAIFPGFGYLGGIIIAYIYNFYAKRFGGIEIFIAE